MQQNENKNHIVYKHMKNRINEMALKQKNVAKNIGTYDSRLSGFLNGYNDLWIDQFVKLLSVLRYKIVDEETGAEVLTNEFKRENLAQNQF